MKINLLKNYIWAPVLNATAFIIGSIVMLSVGNKIMAITFIVFALITSGAMVVFALRERKKVNARYFSLLFMGTGLFLGAGIMGRQNFNVEGFASSVMGGFTGGIVIHYMMAKILGPFIFNRNWCGWACWTVAVLDLLPFKQNRTGNSVSFMPLRFIHFGLSLMLVAGLYYLSGIMIHHGDENYTLNKISMLWFVTGNIVYYIIAIILAYIFRDNRAFCKYLCPVTVYLKAGATFSILRIKGDAGNCTSCKLCSAACPMGIDVARYHFENKRVISSECVMCMNCIAACPENCLTASPGLDIAEPTYYTGINRE